MIDRKSVMFMLALSVIVALAWPSLPWQETARFEISITATGDKSPASNGAEVWIIKLPAGISAQQLVATAPGGWTVRDGVALSHQDQPATVHLAGRFARGSEIALLRHPWSGVAEVTINGVARTYDLYDRQSSKETISIWNFSPEAPRLSIDARFFLVAITAFIVQLGALAVATSSWFRKVDSSPPRPLEIIVFSLPSMLIFAIVLAGTWPAQMSSDSVGQWNQFYTGSYSNAHPIIGTILLAGPGWLFGAVWVSMAVQIAALAASIGLLCFTLRLWRITVPVVVFVSVMTPLWPSVHLMSSVFWKDVPYTIALTIAACLLSEAVRTKGDVLSRRWFIASLGIVLFMIPGIRQNGIIVSAGLAALLVWVFRRNLKLGGASWLLAAGVVLPIICTTVVIPRLGVAPLPPAYGGATAMHVLGAMKEANVNLPQSTIDKMEEIMPPSEWKAGYSCLGLNELFWSPGIRYENLSSDLIWPAISAMVRHPIIALQHYICLNSLNWRISPTENYSYHLVPLGIYQLEGSPLISKPLSDNLHRLIVQEKEFTTSGDVVFSLVWRPAIMIIALLGASVALWLYGGNIALLLICAPCALDTLSMVAILPSQDFRYRFPVAVAFFALIVLLLVFLGRARKGQES